jgi:hypothetical protein
VDVIGLFLAIVFFTLPLTCWGLVARMRRLRVIVGAIIAACLLAELPLFILFAVSPSGLTVALLAVPAVLSLAAIVIGVVIESRGSFRPRLDRKGWTAASLIVVYVLGTLVFLLAGYSSRHPGKSAVQSALGYAPASAPADSSVLPLGPGLVVTSDTTVCTAGCLRQLDVRGAGGLSEQATLTLVRNRLDQLHGWHLAAHGSGYGDCRTEGSAARPWQFCAQVGLFDVGGTTVETVIDLTNAAADSP